MNLQQILMEWSFNNQEYYVAYILYTEFNIGIPNYLLYSLPNKRVFGSVNDFLGNSDTKQGDDKYLQKIFDTFRYSKYTKLPEWGNKYGYKI